MGSSDKQIVYKFMSTANRPFTGNDVFAGVQRQGIGKSAVDKALDQLVKENQVFMKLNGKQKIYCVVQPESTAEDQKEIQAIDEELMKTNQALREVERKYKQSEIEVKAIQGTCSIEEAKRKVAEMEEIVSGLRSQLDQLSGQSGNVPEKERETVKKDYEKITKEYRKRKRMCTEILDSILENCPKSKKALFDEIGIETDESVGMPSL
ncbi:homologous-pairing protein 2 homolog isoform X1 [Sipha flava]|jgi:26S proteasome regulatory subunit (ATPase 3-interacting protein)|uniref:Homologous-pairing protein 2 homolog n=1 Tax=Sipha flava TaxID=143950 RepID=A0A8B8GP97_9HEMI|nr:homologous-pairing protein 2 homolog isoform X1 [Sipha flava]XP_025424836.1 homologous-pairing protein 2 homolog isoform X1 [Sipha flava]